MHEGPQSVRTCRVRRALPPSQGSEQLLQVVHTVDSRGQPESHEVFGFIALQTNFEKLTSDLRFKLLEMWDSRKKVGGLGFKRFGTGTLFGIEGFWD